VLGVRSTVVVPVTVPEDVTVETVEDVVATVLLSAAIEIDGIDIITHIIKAMIYFTFILLLL
tara:strand:+ start:441 stop:626 length:186 start_codon:yes stop_codon:yes gene_type:complete